MKCRLLAVAALLAGAVGLVHADYVIITVDLAVRKTKEEEDKQPTTAPGRVPGAMPGGPSMMPGFPGGMGARGGQGGQNQGNRGGFPGMMPNFPGGMAPGAMAPGAPGIMPGFPGGNQGGFPRAQQPAGRPGAGVGGKGGGLEGGDARVGQGGQPGVGGQGRPGMQGGFPGMMQGMPPGMQGMMPGMQAMMPGLMGRGGSITSIFDSEELDSNPLLVRAIIEVPQRSVKHSNETGRYFIKNRWGGNSTLYFGPDITVQIDRKPTVASQFETKRKEIKDDDSAKLDKLLKLAEWALAHGMLDQVPKVMDEAAAVDAKHPVVVAFRAVEASIKKPVTKDDGAINWRERLGDYDREVSEHYVLLHDVKSDREAKGRLTQLESNFKGFFYWFALRGKVMPVPDRRLVAVLVKDRGAFERKLKDIFDNVTLASDGFYSRRDNLAVFSSTRLDEAYEAVRLAAQNYWVKWTPDELLHAKNMAKSSERARAETMTLLLHALEDESAVSSVSLEGTRQLIAAIGLFPRSVEIPQWIDFGAASFFEVPKGAYHLGTGADNIVYHTNFKLWMDTKNTKKLDPNREEALKGVITDRYFREVRDGKNRDSDLVRARTMSWSLTYYLAKQKWQGLLRYFAELSRLPRDLDFDDDVLLMAFARAFDLIDPAKPNEIDENKFRNLASEWYSFINLEPLEHTELYTQAKAAYDKKKDDIEKAKEQLQQQAQPPANAAPPGRQS